METARLGLQLRILSLPMKSTRGGEDDGEEGGDVDDAELFVQLPGEEQEDDGAEGEEDLGADGGAALGGGLDVALGEGGGGGPLGGLRVGGLVGQGWLL